MRAHVHLRRRALAPPPRRTRPSGSRGRAYLARAEAGGRDRRARAHTAAQRSRRPPAHDHERARVSAGGLSEHALFEIADVAAAAGLAERLARRWDVFVTLEGTDTVGVRAVLPPEPADVAALLRRVDAWVEEESLVALRFEP